MQKLFMVSTLSAVLTLGVFGLNGCNPPSPSVAAQVIADVQAEANKICGLIPDALDIASLIPTLQGGAQDAAAIGTLICNAVFPPGAVAKRRLGAGVQGPIIINGVTVHFI